MGLQGSQNFVMKNLTQLLRRSTSERPEGQEPPVRAVGGQGELREVTQLLCKLEI